MAATSIHPIHTTEIKSIQYIKPIIDIIDFSEFEAKSLQHWADIQNMKNVANMINLLEGYNIKSTAELKPTASVVLAEREMLSSTIDNLHKKIDGLSNRIELVRTFQRTKPFYDEYKSLSPRKQKKFLETNTSAIKQFHESGKALKSLYSDGRFPSVNTLTKQRDDLETELRTMYQKYKELKKESADLDKATRTIEDYL